MSLNMELMASGIGFFYQKDKWVLQNLTMKLKTGAFHAIVGPNGSGKSTLLRLLSGIYKPKAGKVFLETQDLLKMKPRQKAKIISYLPSSCDVFQGSVFDFVLQGRYAHTNIFQSYTQEDKRACLLSMEKLGIEDLKDRAFLSLSSGQKQKATLAQSLLQGANFFLLDEPTSFLDIASSLQVMKVLEKLCKTGCCVCVVLHDILLALQFATNIIVIDKGKICYDGSSFNFLETKVIEDVFGIQKSCNIFPFCLATKKC